MEFEFINILYLFISIAFEMLNSSYKFTEKISDFISNNKSVTSVGLMRTYLKIADGTVILFRCIIKSMNDLTSLKCLISSETRKHVLFFNKLFYMIKTIYLYISMNNIFSTPWIHKIYRLIELKHIYIIQLSTEHLALQYT